MRIGIDAREFKKGAYTGLRIILNNFFAHVDTGGKHDFVFFGNQYTDITDLPGYGEKRIMGEKNTFFWDQVQLPIALKKEKINVFYSPYIKTPLWRVCPYVNAISDINPIIVSRFRGVTAIMEKIHFWLYAFLCGRRAVRIITLSEDARGKVSRVFFIPRSKIEVVYPSVEAAEVLGETCARGKELEKEYALNAPYLLYVGNFNPHKNLGNLILAYDNLSPEIRGKYRLLLVGGAERETVMFRKVIEKNGLQNRIVPIMNIAHRDLFVFFRNASVFVFPSLTEGFGIPPVEAMAMSVPVASSNIAPMTEVLGDAAVFFNPRDPGDIARAVSRLINEEALRKECIKRGLERAKMFKADEMARRILDVLEKAGSGAS